MHGIDIPFKIQVHMVTNVTNNDKLQTVTNDDKW